MVFIVLDPLWSGDSLLLTDREIVERKNHNINSRRCD
jgi:hypothetical protein